MTSGPLNADTRPLPAAGQTQNASAPAGLTPRSLAKAMLPGLLPLAAFIIADSCFGTKAGLAVGCALGVLEFVWILAREKRADLFVLFDIALIIVFSAVSFLLNSDVFFKLKPAVPEGILCVILGVSAFTPANLMQGMTRRYLKGMTLPPAASRAMRRSSAILFVLMSAHTALIVYAAYRMSTAAWGFISGALFYIIFAVYIAASLGAGRLLRRRYNKT